MRLERHTFFGSLYARFKESFVGKHFFNKQFLHYSWIGIFISVLNIFLLWLFIDVLHIPTVTSGVIVVGATFIIRYVLYIFSKML